MTRGAGVFGAGGLAALLRWLDGRCGCRARAAVAGAAWLVLAWLAVAAPPAHAADAYGDVCSGCHAVDYTPTSPPQMLSQTGGASYGKILPRPDDGRLADSCNPAGAPALYLCGLRQKMRGENASGTVVNPTARSNMLSYATSVNNVDLETVRQYLLQVRDGAVSAPSPAPSFASNVVGAATATTSTFSFRIGNYRGVPLNYALGLSGANAADFSLGTPAVSGTGCSATAVPATSTRSARECTLSVTVGFRPAAGGAAGTRNASLHVTLTPPTTPNLDPNPTDTTADKSIALSATATAATPGFSISTSTLTLSSQVGTPVNSAAVTITNPSSATANLALGSLTTPNPFSSSTAAAGDYALVTAASNPCSTAGTTLAPGAGCNLLVRFTPGAKGARNATLTIPHNAAGNPATVALNGTGLQGTVTIGSLAPSPFGSVNVGSSVQRTLAVANGGDAPLTFTSFTAGGDFSVNASGCTSPLAAGGSCTLTLTFAPTAAGTRSATLTVASTASNSPTTFALTGSGVGLADPTLSPASVAAFPATDVGTTSPTTRVLTINNPRANPLTYTPAFGGANAADFAVGSESCASRVVAAGGACTLTLRFTPLAAAGAGTRTAALGLAFAGSGSDPSPATQTVALSGSATVPAPVFAISANPIAFSTTAGTPVTAGATVSNTGNAALTLSSLSFGGSFAAEYALAPSNTCAAGAPIAAGGSCTLAIRFSPGAAGSRGATLSIAHNAAGSPQTVTLNGTASAAPQPAIDLGGTTGLSFGGVSLGSSSGQQGFTVRNTGAAPLTLAALSFSGAAAGDYGRGGSCAAGLAIAAGASCSVSVTFTPGAAGNRAALLTITSDAANTPSRSVTLSGDGVALAEPVASPLPIEPFPSTQLGSTSATVRSISIVNPRANAIGYARSVTGANAADFAVSAESCPTRVIPAGGICTVSLVFTPAAGGGAGNRVAALALTFTGSGADPAPVAQSLALSGTAAVAAPVFAISSNPIGFSAVVGTPGSNSATVSNTGNAVLTLAGLTFGGGFAGEYSFAVGNTCTAGASLAANGGSCTLAIRFAPAAVGSRGASLSIAHDAAGSPQAIALNGTATSAPQPTIDLAGTTALSFGSVGLGSSSAQQTVAVRNIGSAPLNLSALTIAGSAAADFTRGGSCAVGSPVAAGASCTVTVAFAPAAVGARNAVLSIASDASNSPPAATVALAGSGSGLADPLVTPASVAAFPATDVGVTSPTARSVTVTNPRANPLSYVRSFGGVDAADFSVDAESCAGGVVPAGGSCTLTLRFTPAAGGGAGTRIAALGLAFMGSGSDPSPATQTVALSGSATVPAAVFAISANPIGFATAVATPVTVSTVVTNSGGAALTLASLTFGGSFAAEYTLAPSNTCSAGVPIAANGGACTLAIRFVPAAPGSRDASLSIAHNAAGSPQTVTLNGTASAAPQPAIDLGGTTGLSFGGVSLGSSSGQQGFTVRNTGAAPLTLAALSFSGAAAGDYGRGGSCAAGLAIAAGASCSVSVTFTPGAAGNRAALLTITSDAANTPSRSVTLSGDGVALAEPVASPLPIEPFPSTQLGSTSATVRSISIVNPRANAIGYARSVTGANAADFAVSAESCPTRVIPAGGICTVSLVFTPAAGGGAGNRVAALALTFTGSGADPAPVAQSLALSGTAAVAAPVLSVTAGTISLTSVVGGSATGAAVLANTGSAPLALSALAFGGAFAADYSLAPANTCAVPLSLAPGDSCTLAIRFAPPAAGGRDATVTVTHNAAGSPQALTLRGVATAAPQGRIEPDVQQLPNFPDTALGSSSAQTIRLLNNGDAPLNFASLTVGGAAAADFERGGSCAVGVALAVNAQCSVVVTFRPTATLGARVASITFQSDASNGAATFALAGTAVAAPAPQATLSTAALAFGAQTLGGIYPKRAVRLTNSGSADLLNIAVSVSGAGFADASDPPCPATLKAGASCDIGVVFTPSAAGASYGGNVSVASNAAGAPATAALTGSGTTATVPVLAWASPAPYRLDFGALSAGRVSPPQPVTVTNQGPGGAVFTLLNAVGPDAANFPLSTAAAAETADAVPFCQVGQPLFEGASCRIDVRFAPGSAGAKNATLQIASTGSAPPTLSLTGTGFAGPNASLVLSAASLSFDGTRVGAQSLPLEVTLTSDGSGVVRITALDVSGPYAVQAKSCPALPFTLPSGSACTVTLTFQPQAEGSAAGLLRVGSDADPAQRQVALNGDAVPKADLSSGGCSVADGDTLADPVLWALVALAAVALACRRRARGVAGSARR